ncbi:MAG: hypothetical protein HKL86_10500 [Acidimicrobiaceae bacterium]|nr:hypothetical protein [Acidimicrobiaceae bacterium]
MSALRSEGWWVQPTFVPGAPSAPVTLLSDDEGLTQLAGEPPVAWQTPWNEITNLQLTRFTRGLALFATIDAVRYCWRTPKLEDFDALALVVSEHGGSVGRKRRRAGVAVVALVVLIASLGGALGAWLNRNNTSGEIAAARTVNLTLKDLPTTWSLSPPSILSYLFSPANQVITSTTTTTALAANSTWSRVSKLFQSCMGVSASRDRVYGAAGQMPDYQVSSPVFTSLNGDVVMASTTQYYHSTSMVRHDVAEMSKASFGSCFATSNAAVLFAVAGLALPTKDIATSWSPVTFLHGFVRAGVAKLSSTQASQYLVMVEIASGHYEVTLGALVASWPQDATTIANVVSTLLARSTSTSSLAA